jgi:acetolactate synthase regulatory subunit
VRGLTTAAGVWLTAGADAGFAVADLTTDQVEGDARTVAVALELRGNGSVTDLASELDGIGGVQAVSAEARDAGDTQD